jgi:hypothetical protein
MARKPIEALLQELRGLRGQIGSSPRTLLRRGRGLASLQTWTRRALAQAHLVSVAYALRRLLRAGPSDLEELGLPVDLLVHFPAWRRGSRAGFLPPGLGLRPLPAGALQPLGALRLQLPLSSRLAPLTMALIRDLLQSIDRTVRIVAVAEPEADLQRVQRLAHAFGLVAGPRLRFVQFRSATPYAQDDARPALGPQNRPTLLVPRGFRPGSHPVAAALDPEGAVRALGVQVVQSRVYWEGGNILHDSDRCLVGADTIAENMGRLGLTAREVVRLFTADLGATVAVLGDLARARFDPDGTGTTGQASFHLDLDVSLLGSTRRRGRPVALLADPAAGLRRLDRVLAQPALLARHFVSGGPARALLAEDYGASARERRPVLAGYRATLERLGYRVVGVPDLRLHPVGGVLGSMVLDFNYCNVLPGLRAGRAAVHYLPTGVPALDRAAEARFRAAGARPVRVSSDFDMAEALMRNHAGLHCVCAQLP